MALSFLGQTFNTTSGTHTVVATPAVNDLIIIVTANTGATVLTAPTDNNGTGTYSLITSSYKNSSADTLAIYVRTALISSATSTTFSAAPGTTTGGGLAVYKITGSSVAGLRAIRQYTQDSNVAGPSTPTPTFKSAVNTANPVISAVFNGANPAGVTARTGYTADVNTGYATPTSGIGVISIGSGETSSALAWGSSTSTYCDLAIEIAQTTVYRIASQDATASSAAASVTATYPATPTQNNLLIATVYSSNTQANVTITGWTKDVGKDDTAGHSVCIFSKVAGASESTSVVANSTGSGSMHIAIAEYVGLATSTPADQTVSATSGSTAVNSLASGSTATTTVATELWIAAGGVAGTMATPSWTGSFNPKQFTTRVASADTVVYSTGTASTTFSWVGTAVATNVAIATYKTAASGTNYTSSLTGGLSFTGAQIKQDNKPLAAALSFTGNQSRAITHVLTAALSFSGSIAKRTFRAYTAAVSFAGNLATGIFYVRNFTASLSFAGSMSKRTAYVLVASLPFSGSFAKLVGHPLAASLGLTGSFSKSVRRVHAAALSFTGVFSGSRLSLVTLNATLSFAGGVTKRTGKLTQGALSFIGIGNAAFAWVQSKQNNTVGGTSVIITPDTATGVGNLVVVNVKFAAAPGTVTVVDSAGNTYVDTGASVLSGATRLGQWYGVQQGSATTITVSSTNSVAARHTIDEFRGNLGSNSGVFGGFQTGSGTGTTMSVSPIVNEGGALISAAYSASGTVTAGTNYTLSQTLSSQATEYKLYSDPTETAPMTSTSSSTWIGVAGIYYSKAGFERVIYYVLTAALNFTGNVAKSSTRALAGGLSFAGSIQKRLGKALSGGLSFTGALGRTIAHTLAAALSFAGNLSKFTIHGLTGALSFGGGFASSFSHGGTLYLQSFLASLSFDAGGNLVTANPITTSGDNTDATSYTTASFTPATGKLYLLWVYANRAGASSAPTVTGAGLTWVQVKTQLDGPSGDARITLFRAMGSGSTGALTISFGAETETGCTWSLVEYSGVDQTGTNGSGAIVQSNSNTGGLNTNLSVTLSAFASTNNATVGGFGVQLNSSISLGSGYSSTGTQNQALPNLAIRSEYRVDNSTSVTATASSSTSWVGIAAELKWASSGGISRSVGYPLTAALGFTGNINRRMAHVLVAALPFTGTFAKLPSKSFAASLSMTGAFSKFTRRSFTAALSFVGAMAKFTRHLFTATVGFVGSLQAAGSGAAASVTRLIFLLDGRIALHLGGSLYLPF